ncbi:MAG: class I SAM-dependent methyltransferase [Planctomycetota bacterium]
MGDLKRYERFGWDYDDVNPPDPAAEAWYLRHLERTGGPVLELACGAGKLLDVFARAGHEVTGLDLSEAMLDLARRRLAGLPDDVRRRVTLVRGDMADFDLGRTFPAIVLADNSFRELPDRDALRTCLGVVRRHLAPGGLLLLTERRFDPSRYPDGRAAWPFGEPRIDPATGESVRRRIEVRLLEAPRRISGTMTYEITGADGAVTVEECPFSGPVLEVAEYFELFEEAGFAAELRVGYEERPDDGVTPMLCFRLITASTAR